MPVVGRYTYAAESSYQGRGAMNDRSNDPTNPAARLAELTDMVVDQIRKVAELHADGILTEEEFTTKKAELLSRL